MNVLDLCSGYAGIGLGLRIVSDAFRTVAYVEREAYVASLLVQAMQYGDLDTAPVWSDLRTFDARAWNGKLDLVTAGFPCQPVSTAGKRKGTGDERWLWPEVWRITRESGARYLFVENVPGLLSANQGKAFGEILESLAEERWSAEWCSLSASDTGASHKRERLWLLAKMDEPVSSRCWREDYASEQTSIYDEGRESFNAFPPLPDDIEGWERVLESRPDLAPALADDDGTGRAGQTLHLPVWRSRQAVPDADGTGCRMAEAETSPESKVRRMADGHSYRLDRINRLRALGNGVYPLAVAAAFVTLWDRLNRKENSHSHFAP